MSLNGIKIFQQFSICRRPHELKIFQLIFFYGFFELIDGFNLLFFIKRPDFPRIKAGYIGKVEQCRRDFFFEIFVIMETAFKR